jgi:hypothetical protein
MTASVRRARRLRLDSLEARETPALLTGTAFVDSNGNGTQDAGDGLLPGASVSIDLGSDGIIDGTARTGAAGEFGFSSVGDGTHSVRATATGYTPTTANPATVTVSGGVLSQPAIDPILVRPGTFPVPKFGVYSPLNFGLAPNAVVAAGVYYDANGNGALDASEKGVAGVTVGLDLAGDGTINERLTTDANGTVVFTGVPDGKHRLVLTPPAGDVAVGGVTTLDVTVSGGRPVTGLLFPVRAGGSVAGTIFEDRNGNGILDPGEPGIPGATVAVASDGDGVADALVQTDATGSYVVPGVPDGTAVVTVTAPSGYAPGLLTPARLGGFVSAGGAVTGLNFGLGKVAPAVVSGSVFFDINGNGTRDSGEPAVGGVTVYLVAADGTVESTTTTDPTGSFRFAGVPNGTQSVTAIAPGGDTITTASPLSVSVAGMDVGVLSIGVRPTGMPTTGVTGSISGTVFRDENGDGQLVAGDGPLAGATVQVVLTGSGSLAYTTATDASGNYTIPGLTDGTYTVTASVGGAPPATAILSVANGASGTADLGIKSSRSATVAVFVDLNGNGIRDSNEPAASAITVTLTESGAATATRTATTDANGQATFTGLADENYTLAIDVPGATITTPSTAVNVLDGIVTPAQPQIGYRLSAAAGSKIAVGTDAGTISAALVFDGNGRAVMTPSALSLPTSSGVRTAVGDVNGDGVPDYALGSGPGEPADVRVIDGQTGAELFHIRPFEASFTGGVFVALGDVTGDGRADLIVTPDQGGGPRVRVFDSGNKFALLSDFFGIADPNFRGGARAAIGDVNGDGVGDLIVAAGFGGGPRIAVFDGRSLAGNNPTRLFNDLFVFEQSLRNGVYVASGDLNGDGKADIIIGGGPGGGPRVYAVSGADLLASGGATQTVLANFFAGGADGDRTGVEVAVKDLDGDGRADIVAGYEPAAGGAPRLAGYLGKSLSPAGDTPAAYFDIEPYPGFTGGIYVG